MLVWLNGRFIDARRAQVSALDRGLLHGDGVYDTWRTYEGRPFALAAHLRRLRGAARRMQLPAPESAERWARRTRRLLKINGLADGAARLTITRGASGLGPAPDRAAEPTVLLTVRPLPPDLAAQQARGIVATLLPFARNAGPSWGDVKLLSQASAVLGRLVATRRRAAEGLYVGPDGCVAEGTTSNVFAVHGRTLETPPADGSILSGVTRDMVLRIAAASGMRVRERRLPVTRLLGADEVFVTASTIEVLPVVRIDRRRIGKGTPGVATRRLQAAYHAAAVAAARR